jgi:DNA-binding transcriptional ArsR family regulator
MDLRLLNPRTFRALASPTRAKVLRLLAERPHTPAELARAIGLTEQTVQYHLEKLNATGLTMRRKDEERPWAYHELTPDGRALVESPPSARTPLALAVLATVVAASLGIAWQMAQPEPLPPNSIASPAPAPDWVAWAGWTAIVVAFIAAVLLVVVWVGRRARRGLASAPHEA